MKLWLAALLRKWAEKLVPSTTKTIGCPTVWLRYWDSATGSAPGMEPSIFEQVLADRLEWIEDYEKES